MIRTFLAILPVLVTTALLWADAPVGVVEPSCAPPDLLFFEQHVATELHSRCAGCHSDAELAGDFLLEPLDDLVRPKREILLRNFRTTLRFLDDGDDPGQSRLLRMAMGGTGHGGGAIFRSRSHRDFQTLLHFALGATLSNRPPEAILERELRALVGKPLTLDGTLSGDSDGDTLSYRWELPERPAGSNAVVRPEPGGTAQFAPDLPGTYRVSLTVRDGRLRSAPASLLVIADAPRPTITQKSSRPDREAEPAEGQLPQRLDAQRLRLIRRLYFDLKWRSPKLDEIARGYAVTHAQMVDALLDDSETWAIWYEQQLFYFLLLDRFRPRGGRLSTLPDRLASGESDVVQGLQEIVRSQEFGARNPGNDTFVTVVLEQCLGLVVQEKRNLRILESGKKMYDGYKSRLFKQQGDSQADFVRIVFGQDSLARHFLARTWQQLHSQPIDSDLLESCAVRLRRDGRAFRAILKEWLTAPAYVEGADRARTKASIPYVRALFLDLLGRTPSYEELRNVRNAFLSLADPTPIRLVMGRILLQSSQARMPVSVMDPERFVGEQFVRLLARPATPGELNAFTEALKSDPTVTPEVVLWTLVSSAEYQSY